MNPPPASTPRFCPQCGAPRRPNAKVCNRCGHRFARTDESSAPLAAPTAAPLHPEAPIQQSEALGEPIDRQIDATLPPPGAPRPDYDLSGDPAPYISREEFERTRLAGRTTRWEFIQRVLRALLGNGGNP